MSLAVWLGEDKKCLAAVVGLDLLLGLSEELEESLAVTSKSRRLRGASEGYNRHMLKRVFAAVRREQQIVMFFF